MDPRIKNTCLKLNELGLDGFLVSSPSNISYLTRYISRDSYFLVSPKENIYITDSRYTEEAKLALKGKAKVQKTNGSVFKTIAESCLTLGLKSIGFEERHLIFAEHAKIRDFLKKKGQLVGTHSIIESLRQIKEPQELEKIRKALKIAGIALRFTEGFIKPGQREVEVAGEIERFIRYQGASKAAFDIIVGSGPNSSYPHHISSQRELKRNEPVLIDMGVEVEGYKCDLTRVFFLGKIKGLVREIFDITAKAQALAIDHIKPGVKASEVDQAGRRYIAQKGYGKLFGHNLGHGVGLDVHELPHISVKENTLLEPGMVFTVEPGIYLPGKFGIRIEDMVLVTKERVEVLSGLIH